MPARLASLCTLLVLLTGLAGAQSPILYDEGSYAFDYQQWPFGSYSGSFSAEGAMLDSLNWGGSQLESVGGALEVVADTTTAWAYGAVYNDDDTVDLSLLFVRSAGELMPGYHPIDLTNFLAMFVYFDGIAEFVIPEDPSDVQAWLDGVVADYLFFGSTGGITVTAVSDTSFAGSFSGQMIDTGSFTIISIEGGEFALTGGPVLTAAPVAPAMLAHGSYPNPFNPATRLFFTLPAAGPARVTVHDVAGRRVALLFDGLAPAGRSELDWEAGGLPAGVYLYRVESSAGRAGGKLVLLP